MSTHPFGRLEIWIILSSYRVSGLPLPAPFSPRLATSTSVSKLEQVGQASKSSLLTQILSRGQPCRGFRKVEVLHEYFIRTTQVHQPITRTHLNY